jgi:uncharacterized protein YndB with AHSA1/START domain
MATTLADQDVRTLSIVREIEIAAPVETAFEAILEQLGPASDMPDGTPMPMVIEPFPGGRWFRDLGNKAGHLWGHIQVIKPPGLLEICGPMFMSYPAVNHLQYRLAPQGDGTRLKLTHRAFGQIPQEFVDRTGEGWNHVLKGIRQIAERRGSEPSDKLKR